MCTGAILLYKIPRVVIGENATFKGNQTEELLRSRGVEVVVVDDAECKVLMSKFVEEKPHVSRAQSRAVLKLNVLANGPCRIGMRTLGRCQSAHESGR